MRLTRKPSPRSCALPLMMIMSVCLTDAERRLGLLIPPVLSFSMSLSWSKDREHRVEIRLRPATECPSLGPRRRRCGIGEECPEFHPVVDEIERQPLLDTRIAG